MIIKHTFYSHALESEETICLVLPDHTFASTPAYNAELLASHKAKLPVLYLPGEKGRECDWWLRHTMVESDINRPDRLCAAIGIRGHADADWPALMEELAAVLPALFPLNRNRQYMLVYGEAARQASALEQSKAVAVLPAAGEDARSALAEALRRIAEQEVPHADSQP
ncbi:MAG: hypothetical protein J1E43_09220 [Christensenellaceae bacterium]|nr:hypothetical protein [Christensenellaceae bacterium]